MSDGAESSMPDPPVLLLASARYIACGVPHLSGILGVVELIREFLDCRLLWDLPRACALGDVPLLRSVARHQELYPTEWAKDEPLFRAWQFSSGTVVAFRHGHLGVLEWLMSEFDTETPVTRGLVEAVKYERLEMLRWLSSSSSLNERSGGLEHAIAVVNRRLDNAQGLYHESWDVLDQTAKVGDMDMIRWLSGTSVNLNTTAIANAVEFGHLEALLFMLQHWDLAMKDVCMGGKPTTVAIRALNGAAASGHLHVLTWLYENNDTYAEVPLLDNAMWTATVMDKAAENGHLDVVQWLHQARAEGCTKAAMDGAAGNGHLHVVEWLVANRKEGCTTAAMDNAAGNEHHHIVQWLHANRGEGSTSAAMDGAASSGHFDVVRWLHKDRHEGCTTLAMDGAAKNNHVEIARWLHEQRFEGCTTATMDGAAGNGHLEMVQWLHEHRTEGCTTHAMDSAAAGGHLHVVKWLHNSQTEGCTVGAMDGAAKGAHFEVIKWLHDYRNEGCSSAAIDNAAGTGTGRLDIIQWLDAEYDSGCTDQAMVNAAVNGHFNVVLYLKYNHLSEVSLKVAEAATLTDDLEMMLWCQTFRRGVL